MTIPTKTMKGFLELIDVLVALSLVLSLATGFGFVVADNTNYVVQTHLTGLIRSVVMWIFLHTIALRNSKTEIVILTLYHQAMISATVCQFIDAVISTDGHTSLKCLIMAFDIEYWILCIIVLMMSMEYLSSRPTGDFLEVVDFLVALSLVISLTIGFCVIITDNTKYVVQTHLTGIIRSIVMWIFLNTVALRNSDKRHVFALLYLQATISAIICQFIDALISTGGHSFFIISTIIFDIEHWVLCVIVLIMSLRHINRNPTPDFSEYVDVIVMISLIFSLATVSGYILTDNTEYIYQTVLTGTVRSIVMRIFLYTTVLKTCPNRIVILRLFLQATMLATICHFTDAIIIINGRTSLVIGIILFDINYRVLCIVVLRMLIKYLYRVLNNKLA